MEGLQAMDKSFVCIFSSPPTHPKNHPPTHTHYGVGISFILYVKKLRFWNVREAIPICKYSKQYLRPNSHSHKTLVLLCLLPIAMSDTKQELHKPCETEYNCYTIILITLYYYIIVSYYSILYCNEICQNYLQRFTICRLITKQ